MNRYVLILILILAAKTAPAQDWTNPLTRDAEKVYNAYYVFNKNRLSIADNIFFLQSFPATKDKFVFVFDPDDKKQLYKAYNDYLQAFEDAGKLLPDSVLKIGVHIGKDMKWASGVSERFQHALLTVAAEHPVNFVDWAYSLKKKELHRLVTYMADVESNPECAIYLKLIKALHEVGAYNLEGMLQRARTYTH